MMIIVSAETGFARAILLDDGCLTDLRTGVAGAIVARHPARKSMTTVARIGSGTQVRKKSGESTWCAIFSA